jgi:hypothetical protein
MKKLIGIFAILLITTGVFGQRFIRKESEVERIENEIQYWKTNWKGIDGNYDWIQSVHFIRNNMLYMLSYEPMPREKYIMGAERDIYLYGKDLTDINSPWVKTSEIIPLRGLWLNPDNYSEVDFFRAEKSNGSEGNVVQENNCVKITIGYILMTNGTVHTEPITFKLKSVNNIYKVMGDGERSSL